MRTRTDDSLTCTNRGYASLVDPVSAPAALMGAANPQAALRRAATMKQRRCLNEAIRVERQLRREIAPADAVYVLSWLGARSVTIHDSAMTPAQCLQWLRRARKAVGTQPRPDRPMPISDAERRVLRRAADTRQG